MLSFYGAFHCGQQNLQVPSLRRYGNRPKIRYFVAKRLLFGTALTMRVPVGHVHLRVRLRHLRLLRLRSGALAHRLGRVVLTEVLRMHELRVRLSLVVDRLEANGNEVRMRDGGVGDGTTESSARGNCSWYRDKRQRLLRKDALVLGGDQHEGTVGVAWVGRGHDEEHCWGGGGDEVGVGRGLRVVAMGVTLREGLLGVGRRWRSLGCRFRKEFVLDDGWGGGGACLRGRVGVVGGVQVGCVGVDRVGVLRSGRVGEGGRDHRVDELVREGSLDSPLDELEVLGWLLSLGEGG